MTTRPHGLHLDRSVLQRYANCCFDKWSNLICTWVETWDSLEVCQTFCLPGKLQAGQKQLFLGPATKMQIRNSPKHQAIEFPNIKPHVVVYTCNPSTGDSEAGGL
jgi:hypothetical protein